MSKGKCQSSPGDPSLCRKPPCSGFVSSESLDPTAVAAASSRTPAATEATAMIAAVHPGPPVFFASSAAAVVDGQKFERVLADCLN